MFLGAGLRDYTYARAPGVGKTPRSLARAPRHSP